ncbi:MAG: 6-pyruvoyl tetrahydropterin synthase family protein [Phycisphaerae bacterium]
MYELVILAEFAAAHQIRLPDGTLEPLHGHNWRVEAILEAPNLDDTGIVADFTGLQADLRQVTAELHNTHLNALAAFTQDCPTTERVARHIHRRFAATLPPTVKLRRVCVWETADCAAAYVPDATGRPPT